MLFYTLPAFAVDEVCQHVSHKPVDNVHHVGSADLNSSFKYEPQPIVVPIKIDLASRYNLTLPRDVPELEPEVANLTIFPDGRVMFNGQNVSENIDALCNDEAPSHRQEEPKPVISKPVEMNKEIIEGQYPENE